MAGAVVEYLRHEILPVTMAAWHRLDVPSWKVYKPALEEFLLDTWKAGQSTAQLSYLTLRPVAMLCLIVVEAAWAVAQVFLRVLLSQGLVQARKGLLQIRVAAIWLYRFQMNLSRTELLGEAGLVVMSIALYYSYKWIKRQTYWRRFMKWYSLKKQQTIEVSYATLRSASLRSSCFSRIRFLPLCKLQDAFLHEYMQHINRG